MYILDIKIQNVLVQLVKCLVLANLTNKESEDLEIEILLKNSNKKISRY